MPDSDAALSNAILRPTGVRSSAVRVAELLSQLLEAIAKGQRGGQLANLLGALERNIRDGEVVITRGVPLLCNEQVADEDVIHTLQQRMVHCGVHRLHFAADTTQPEILKFAALLAESPRGDGTEFAHLWHLNGAWRIAIEVDPSRVTPLGVPPIDPDRLPTDTLPEEPRPLQLPADASQQLLDAQQMLLTLMRAWEAEQNGAALAEGEAFDELATADNLQTVALLVAAGASSNPTQPVGAVLRRARDRAVQVLLAQLADARTGSDRRRYFDAIVRSGHGTPHVIRALEHPQWFVARNAALLLGTWRAPGADSALLRLLYHDDARVRTAAVDALARLGTVDAWRGIDVALRDIAPEVRTAAWRAAAQRPMAPGLAVTVEALQRETDPEVQGALVGCVRSHPAPELLDALVRFCARGVSTGMDGHLVCDALEILAEARPRQIRPFLRRLLDRRDVALKPRVQELQERADARLG